MAKTRRGFETVGDMVRSLGVVLAVVLVTVLITIRTHGQEVRVVNYTPTLTEARRFTVCDVVRFGDDVRITLTRPTED